MLTAVTSHQPDSLLLQPRGPVVRAGQRGPLLWLAGGWSSCHHGGLLCQWWGGPSRHGGHCYGCGQQPHHFQRKHLPDSWWKYGGEPQPHITLITLILRYGEQLPYQCFCYSDALFQIYWDSMWEWKQQPNCLSEVCTRQRLHDYFFSSSSLTAMWWNQSFYSFNYVNELLLLTPCTTRLTEQRSPLPHGVVRLVMTVVTWVQRAQAPGREHTGFTGTWVGASWLCSSSTGQRACRTRTLA